MTTTKDKIWLSSPHMGGRETTYVQEAFDTNWIAPLGPNVNAFEAALQERTQARAAAALASGTSALHLAMVLLDVQAGDYVLCQSKTFSASANPILYQGATPVFIDSEPETWNMDPGALETAIQNLRNKGKQPKAIVVVHLYGMPAKMNEILALANRYAIPVIEDAAEALGSSYHGRPCGSLGRLNVLSFNGNKIITTSGGGALLSDDVDLIERARFLATQARDPAPHYEHSQVGYNYRLSNVLAGIGRGQLEVLDERVAQRRANFERYRAFFSKWNERGYAIAWAPEGPQVVSNRWLTAILINPKTNHGLTRDILRLALAAENIEARPLWKPMHLQPVFADAPYYGGNTAEYLFTNGLCLPSGSNLSDDDFTRIFSVLEEVLSQYLSPKFSVPTTA